MKDNQKFPGMVVLHYNGRIYGNAYLIAFKVGTLDARAHAHAHANTHVRTHTHKHIQTLAPLILPLLETAAEGFFRNIPEFGR
jgi:hypothetical protein